MRKNILSFSFIAAAALLVGSQPVAAQPQDVSFELVRTFDYPASSGYLFGGTGQINDHGVFVLLVQQDTTEAGALGRASGGFSQPFSVPDATGSTLPLGINNRGLVCGFYLSDKFHGFFRRGLEFKTYDAPLRNIASTIVESVNNAGNFAGQAVAGGLVTAYTVIDRAFIPILTMPQARGSGINGLDEVVGSYVDDTGEAYHAFFRAPDGTLTMPIDFPGALRTIPRAINDSGYIVGSWAAETFDHGFVIQLPDTFFSYDVPGSIVTVITGINNSGQICGYYQDPQFGVHGFIAQLVEQ